MTNAKKYKLIYSDPPWQFANKKTGGNMSSGAAAKYNVTMMQRLIEMDVNSLADDDCVLAMWWVGSMPREAIVLIESWGFEVKNMNGIVWNKLTATGLPFFGMGFWTRAGSESIALAVKGKPKRASASVRAVFRAEQQVQFEAVVGEHSAKPPEVRDMLVKLVGDVPRLEMFCRGSAPGWDVFGDQADGSILMPRVPVDGDRPLNFKKWIKSVLVPWVPKMKRKRLSVTERTAEDILENGV
ncbi:MAG: MT-A70 family methyltransferase [Rickettsiales bacterium]